jgi:crossover junction endodeoxyribonuclease RuvC
MLILGIDPGTATTGFGLIKSHNNALEVMDWGLIETVNNGSPGKRLVTIYKQVKILFKKHNPDIVAIEKIFFATNAKTAMAVGQAHGVMLFAAAQANLETVEYAPGTIKKMVAGDGRADKKMMQKSLREKLGAKVRSKARKRTHFDNAADALAVALCHIYKLAALGIS